MHLPPAIAELAEHQLGVLSRRQLLEGGVSEGQIRAALGGRWRSLLPRVVLLQAGTPSNEQRMVGALLMAGPEAWLGAMTAATLHRLPGCSMPATVEVFVPPSRKPRRIGFVRVRRSVLTGERLVEKGPLRYSCVSRALVDAAADASDDNRARSLVIEAVHRRQVRVDDVSHWIEARQPNGRRRLRGALSEAVAGAWSVPEADLAALVRGSRSLPEPWLNPELIDAGGRRLTTPDLWLDDVAMALMVHSRQFHAGELDWTATVDGDNDLQIAGAVVLGFTPSQIERDPRSVRDRIERAHAAVLGRPRVPGLRATRHVVTRWSA